MDLLLYMSASQAVFLQYATHFCLFGAISSFLRCGGVYLSLHWTKDTAAVQPSDRLCLFEIFPILGPDLFGAGFQSRKMADDKEEETMPKGNEWEVLALTDSEYAAAPGPKQSPLDASQSTLLGDDAAETSNPMFMSGHFVFPRSQNENLQEKAEHNEEYSGKGGFDDVSEPVLYQEGKPDSKHEEHFIDDGLIPDEFPRTSNIDEKGDEMSFNFADDASSNLFGKEQSMQSAVKFDLRDSKATSLKNEELSECTEPSESLGDAENASLSNVQQHGKEVEDNSEPANLPCEAWWKKHAASLYDHAKNKTPFWSIFVAAAVMGLVILGHRWQRDRQQALLPKSLVIDDEGTGWILGPVSRLKAVTLGGQPVHTSEMNFEHLAKEIV